MAPSRPTPEPPDAARRNARLLNQAPWAVIELDLSLQISAWNQRAAQLFGVAPADALGRSAPALLPGDDPFWRRVGEEPSGERHVTHALPGGPRTIAWSWQRLAGEPEAIACYGCALTAEFADEEADRLRSLLLQSIVDNVDMVVWAMDRRGVCVYHDGLGVERAGLRRGHLVGTDFFERYRETGGSALLQRVLAGETQQNSSDEFGVLWENWMIPARDAKGEVSHLVGFSLNVTEHRRGEQELRATLSRLEQQQQVIRQLSTPILQVWERVLALPLIGVVDSARAAELMDNLLQSIARDRARFAILDMTGVETLDSEAAGHLVGLVRAIGLLGAEGVLTGIRPGLAQTVVALGLDLATITVRASLREALEHCIARMRPGERRA